MAVEVLFLLPVVMGVLFACVQLGLLVAANQQLTAASAQAARVAAQGGAEKEIRKAAEDVLGDGPLAGADIHYRLTDDLGQPLKCGDLVEVRVQMAATDAVPNFLGWIGFSAGDEPLVGRTALRME